MDCRSCSSVGISLREKEYPKDVTYLYADDILRGVYVPWEIWSQVQHFVSRIIERDQDTGP